MRFAKGAAALVAGWARLALLPIGDSAGRAPRATSPRTRRWIRCAATALALGLGLNGVGLCLCAPGPERASAADPHSCSPKPAGHHAGTAAGTVVEAAASCCGSQMIAPAFVARIDGRDVPRQALTTVAVAQFPPDAPLAPSMVGASATSFRSPSSSRTAVLRI